jgi:type IV fimbrial biogenesis protein FimT
MSEMTRKEGFTLIELMVTVALLTILIGIAVPSFVETVNRNAVTGAANDLLASVLLARSEAIKREVRVVVQQQGGDWSQWRVYADDDGDGVYDGDPEVLIEDYFHNGPVPVGNGSMVLSMGFNSRGRTIAALNTANDYFQITQGQHTRYLCFNNVGRPRVQEGTCP